MNERRGEAPGPDESPSIPMLDRLAPSSYLYRMSKKAISVTLRPENLLWLRGQAHASSRRSVSEMLDELIAEARAGARGRPDAIKSVVGSIRIQASDPGLARADGAIRGFFPPPPAARRPRRLGAAGHRARRD